MKNLKKRAIAFFVDAFVIAGIFELSKLVMDKNGLGYYNKTTYILLLLCLVFRDALFRNASLGKKLVGLAVYDEKWSKPRISRLVVRATLSLSVGYIILIKCKLTDGNLLPFFDFERDHLRARTVDKKLLKDLCACTTDDPAQITRAYDDYLRMIYGK